MLITITDQWVKITILEYGKSARSKRKKKKKTETLDFIKMKTSVQRTPSRKHKGNPQSGRKYLQITYLTIK